MGSGEGFPQYRRVIVEAEHRPEDCAVSLCASHHLTYSRQYH